jgi:hypothetical protein
MTSKNYLGNEQSLLILGSLNAKQADRELKRSEIIPCHLLINGDLKPVSFFNDWGKLGISSLTYNAQQPMVLYLSTGDDLHRIDLQNKNTEEISIPRLKDIHEISSIDNTVWISNTGYDELIAFDTSKRKVNKRINLNAYRSKIEVKEEYDKKFADGQKQIKEFHCNQIFQGYNGDIYCLVHHVTGKQFIKQMAQKLIKSQGNGGVINITKGYAVTLKLSGPHNVRKIDNCYWVCNSGQAQMNIYNATWSLINVIQNKGWGRGVDFSEKSRVLFLGVSATRKRYLKILKGVAQSDTNIVEIISIDSKKSIEYISIPTGIEQINNIYIISDQVANCLLNLTA